MALWIVFATDAWHANETLAQPSATEMDRIDAALRQADQLEGEGKASESIALMEATLDRTKRTFPAESPAMAAVLNGLGKAYARGQRFKDAEALFRAALKIARAQPTETGTLRLSSLNNLVEVLWKTAKYDEALPLCQESLEGVEQALGSDDWRTNVARDTLAKVYLSAKRPADAVPVSRLALKYAEARYKGDHPETIPFRNTLSTALMQAGQYPEAEKLFKESQAIAAKQLSAGHEFSTATANGLASLYQLTDRVSEAAALAARAAEGLEGRTDVPESDDAVVVNNQATMLMQAGRLPEAEGVFLRALELSKKSLGADHPQTAAILANLADLYTRWARFADAERYAQESLALVSRNPGSGTVAEAKGKNGLGMIYLMTGRYEDAEPLLETSLRILEDRLDPEHPDTTFARHNLNGLYWATGRNARAVEEGERALASLQRRLKPETGYSALLLLGLGQSYVMLGRLDDAEARLVKAVEIYRKLGRVTSESASADNALAGLYMIKGRYSEAEALYRHAVDQCERSHGAEHPDTAVTLDNLASFHACREDWRAAADLFDRTRRLRRSFLDRTLPALPEDDQIALIEMSEQVSRDSALSLALKQRGDPAIAARSAEWVLNSKGVAFRGLAERAVLARDSDNPEASRLLAQREETRGRLARLALSVPNSVEKTASKEGEYDDLVSRERELSRQLGLALRNPSLTQPWAELQAVRAALPADSVLVEFARIRVVEYASDVLKMGWRPSRYAAWLIPPIGDEVVTLVDLGPADDVDRAVSVALRAIQGDPGHPIEESNELAVERSARAALDTLSKQVLLPLLPRLGTARRWVMSPDSALWLVPWAALPVADSRYAVEDHLIFLSTSGRELLSPERSGAPTKPAILADPDYDLDPSRVLSRAREIGRGHAASPARRGLIRHSTSASIPGAFERQDGFRDEAQAVTSLMETYAGSAPEMFLGASASETVFKNLHGPKALLISTHGIFLEGTELVDEKPPLSPGPPRRAHSSTGGTVNHLLRCSLALAGYNRRLTDPAGGDLDDGLLTGLEVVGADLRGTELVVLSACETAVGEVRACEGVASLRQAFQLAGAGSVAATLWQVPDRESYQLVAAFFQGLASNRGPASSLRDAQLALIADRRARLGAAHPYYWAAYTLTGRPGPSWRQERLLHPLSPDLPEIAHTSIGASVAPRVAISPVTGKPDSKDIWTDLVLAAILFLGGSYAARWWWRVGVSIPRPS